MIEIRADSSDEAPAIRRVHEQAFGRPNEARLVELLHAANKALASLVAMDDGQVLGHVLFSSVTIDPLQADFNAVGLAPVAVLPDHQRQGIGSRLIREGLERCRQAGYVAVVVLGDPHYYSRFGFKRASHYGLRNEYNADEHFMALELKEGALRDLQGVVKYAPEFNEADC